MERNPRPVDYAREPVEIAKVGLMTVFVSAAADVPEDGDFEVLEVQDEVADMAWVDKGKGATECRTALADYERLANLVVGMKTTHGERNKNVCVCCLAGRMRSVTTVGVFLLKSGFSLRDTMTALDNLGTKWKTNFAARVQPWLEAWVVEYGRNKRSKNEPD